MGAPFHLITTDLTGRKLVMDGGKFVVILAEREHLPEKIAMESPSLQYFFSEPVLRDDTAIAFEKIAWYTRIDTEVGGKGEPFDSLKGEKRKEAESALRTSLQSIKVLLQNPGIGYLIGKSLLIPSLHDVIYLNGKVILTNWGLIPEELDDSDEKILRRHFKTTLGLYCDYDIPLGSRKDSTLQNANTALAATTVNSMGTPEINQATSRSIPVGCPPWYKSPGFIAFYAMLIFALGVLVGWYLHPSRYTACLGLDSEDIVAEEALNAGLRDRIKALNIELQQQDCAIDEALLSDSDSKLTSDTESESAVVE